MRMPERIVQVYKERCKDCGTVCPFTGKPSAKYPKCGYKSNAVRIRGSYRRWV